MQLARDRDKARATHPAGELEEDAERRQDDGEDDVDAVGHPLVRHLPSLSPSVQGKSKGGDVNKEGETVLHLLVHHAHRSSPCRCRSVNTRKEGWGVRSAARKPYMRGNGRHGKDDILEK